ncbi:hypothetical protein ABZ281_19040 [Streptomyces sp. NPDC006265]|uniref:hypothetical protein n=1 Tax=Streptomyces sp. NPDC006265 TaxID=3156740 RepID=UPI0033BE93B4
MLTAGIDVKIVSNTFGHSDTRITRDLYQSVLPHVGKSAAEATAKLVPLRRKAEAEEAAQKAEQARKKAKRAKNARAEGKKKSQRKKPQEVGPIAQRSRTAHPSRVPASRPCDAPRPEQQKTPGQRLPDLGFLGAPCRIRTDDLRITRSIALSR